MSYRSRARILLLILVPATFAAGQADNPDDHPGQVGAVAIENLRLLGKVWGYVKYRHPAVTEGCLDWDQELLDQLPIIVDARSASEIQRFITQWLGGVNDRGGCDREKTAETHLDDPATWINDRDLLGAELSGALKSISPSTSSIGQHYLRQQPGVGNPIFNNESDYADIDVIDWRYRLLALYRFWNIIEYWFPYRHQIDDDWDDVLARSVPAFINADDGNAYELELARLVATIKDGHANLWSSSSLPPAGDRTVPFAIRMIEGKPFAWRTLSRTGGDDSDQGGPDNLGLQVGDVVLAVNGRPVEQIFDEYRPFHGASNKPHSDRRIAQTFLRGDEDSVALTIDRNGAIMPVVARRVSRELISGREDYWHDRPGDTFQLLADDVAYLKLSTIERENIPDYIEQANEAGALIIDIRSYPGQFVVFALGQHLVSESTPFARFTAGDLSAPGTFRWTQPISIEPAEPHFSGKLVIIADDSSLSQAEYTTMAFRAAPNAIVVGNQTAGADGNVSRVPLPGGHAAGMSGIGVFYPDKTPTQRIGIVPDITVEPTIEGLRSGRDEVLEEAIRHIVGVEFPEQELRNIAAIPNF